MNRLVEDYRGTRGRRGGECGAGLGGQRGIRPNDATARFECNTRSILNGQQLTGSGRPDLSIPSAFYENSENGRSRVTSCTAIGFGLSLNADAELLGRTETFRCPDETRLNVLTMKR
jgi:hypothetical protein